MLPVHTKTAMCFSVVEAKHVPLILSTDGLVVEGHRVLLALTDKKRIIGNCQQLFATVDPAEPLKWKFGSSGFLSSRSNEDNTCFIRSNDQSSELSILFELVVDYCVSDNHSKRTLYAYIT